MKVLKPRLWQAAISGLVYGLGLLIGSIFSRIISTGIEPTRYLSGNQGILLVQGILLAFAIAGLGGFFGGFVGGWTLPVVGRKKGRLGYAWQSGLTFGVGFGMLIFPALLIISLLSFYEISSIPARVFSLVFGIVGLIFGLIAGGILGTLTFRRFYSPAAWGGGLGFALGGMGLGYGLWRYLQTVTNGELGLESVNWLLVGFFLFGALGGGALGMVYQRAENGLESSSLWMHRLTVKGWYRRIIIAGAAFLLLALLIRPILASVGDMLTPVDAQLSPILELETVGTHWLDKSEVTDADELAPAISSGGSGNLLWAG